jgi:hypothetical protein
MGWITLYEAYTRLQQKYPTLLAHQALEIIEGAVRSGLPFVRGTVLGRAFERNYPELIGDQIKNDDYVVDVFSSVIFDWGPSVRWQNVQAHWEKFILYVEENLLPAEISPKPAKRKTKPQQQASRRKRSRRPGPARDSVGLGKLDAKLFPKLKRLMTKDGMSATAAALKLVSEGKVAGNGSPENKAKRLAGRFLKEQRVVRRNSPKLSETR